MRRRLLGPQIATGWERHKKSSQGALPAHATLRLSCAMRMYHPFSDAYLMLSGTSSQFAGTCDILRYGGSPRGIERFLRV